MSEALTEEPAPRRFGGLRRALGLTARELRVSARSGGPYKLRGGLLTVILILGVWIVAEAGSQQAPGLQVLGIITFCNAIALAFLGSVLFAGALPEEKEAGTLGLLKLSGFSGIAILAGKGISQLLQVILVLAIQLPFAVLCRTLGGVSSDQVLGVYAVLLCAAIGLFGLGTLWGTVITTSRKAVAATFWSMALFEFGAYPIWGLLELLSPYPAAPRPWGILADWDHNTVHSRLIAIGDESETLAGVVPSLLLWVGIGVACVLIAWRVFEWATQREPSSGTGRKGLAALLPRRRKKGDADGGTTKAKRPTVLCPWEDAVLWRDFHHGTGGWIAVIWRIAVLVGIAIFFPLIFAIRVRLEEVAGFMAGLGLIGMLALGASFAGAVFRDEIKEQTLGALVALPAGRNGRTYRWSKARGILFSLFPAFVVFLLGTTLLFLDGELRNFDDAEFWLGSSMVLMWGFWTLAMIVWVSLKIRRGAGVIGIFITGTVFALLAAFMGRAMNDEGGLFLMVIFFSCFLGAQLKAIGSSLDRIEQDVT